MHTRFEHSLGVMHTASLLYDSIQKRSQVLLEIWILPTTTLDSSGIGNLFVSLPFFTMLDTVLFRMPQRSCFRLNLGHRSSSNTNSIQRRSSAQNSEVRMKIIR